MSVFRLQYNGLTIDSESNYRVNQIEGLDGVLMRTSSDLLVAQNGGNIWKQNYEMRSIAFNGTVIGDTAEDYFNNKSALVSAYSITSEDTYLTIRLWDGTEKSIKAKVTLPPMFIEQTGRVNYGEFRIELQCPDIYFSDSEATLYSTTIGSSSGYPVASNLPTPVGVISGGSVTVSNTGDVPTTAVMYIDGLVTNCTVENRTTGESFNISTTINSGETVSLYRDNYGLFVSMGTSNYFRYFSGDFFDMALGDNDIRFNASSSDSSALLRIEFKNKFLTI